jgi:photosystem II stability/assembly factor-like uncharacterized protein
MPQKVMRSAYSRVWTIRYGAGPGKNAAYQGLWRAGAVSWDQGDVERIFIPDVNQYGAFVVVGKTMGEPTSPEIGMTARYAYDRSAMLQLTKDRCDHDVQIHMGECLDPQDFNRGWQKVIVLEKARATNYSTDDLGALDYSENQPVNEESTFSGEDLYEIVHVNFARKADSNIVNEVTDVVFCDAKNCGECGTPSDGCQTILAVTRASPGSPGLMGEVVYSKNGGDTWADTLIDTMTVAETPSRIVCLGSNVVIISADGIAIHYTPIADLLAGTETWTKVTTGLNASGGPRRIYSYGPSQSWIVGYGGYVYFTDDPTAGVEVQDAGSATTQQLNDVHGIDQNFIVAVGNSNAIIRTRNGGQTWESITGPSVGVALNAVWVVDEKLWWVGTAGGNLYNTRDGGLTWIIKPFKGSGAGSITDIKFSTRSVGWLSHTDATPLGRILRTIDGGQSWFTPTDVGQPAIPTNTRINTLAVCADPNMVYGAGNTTSNDGILLQGA